MTFLSISKYLQTHNKQVLMLKTHTRWRYNPNVVRCARNITREHKRLLIGYYHHVIIKNSTELSKDTSFCIDEMLTLKTNNRWRYVHTTLKTKETSFVIKSSQTTRTLNEMSCHEHSNAQTFIQ